MALIFVPMLPAGFISSCGQNSSPLAQQTHPDCGRTTFYESVSVFGFGAGGAWCGHTYQLVDWKGFFELDCN